MKYSQCVLVRKVKGTGNTCLLMPGQFRVLNDDTYEVWQRNDRHIKHFKQWYLSLENDAKLTGSYPRYTLITNH